MTHEPVTRDVDAGKPRWRRTRLVKAVRHYTNREARVAYIRSRLEFGSSRKRAIRCLRRLSDADVATLERYLSELEEDRELLEHLADAETAFAAAAPGLAMGSVHRAAGLLLYALVRASQPELVVETGTASGVSTAFFLAALDRNGAGRLVSIDLPFSFSDGFLVPLVEGSTIGTDYAAPIPPGREPGWVVPRWLRERWELHLGDSRELLPRVLDDLGEIGLFYHDSLHIREHMQFEFETAWPRLVRGGVLAADDVFQTKHGLFPAFARSVGRPYVTFEGLGFIRKT